MLYFGRGNDVILDGLSDLGAIMLLADKCGAVVAAQSYSPFHFNRRNTCA